MNVPAGVVPCAHCADSLVYTTAISSSPLLYCSEACYRAGPSEIGAQLQRIEWATLEGRSPPRPLHVVRAGRASRSMCAAWQPRPVR